MIERYSVKDINSLWDENNRFKIMLDVEIAVARAWTEVGRIPEEALKEIQAKAKFTVERIQEIERKTQHDVVAFVSAVTFRNDKQRYFRHSKFYYVARQFRNYFKRNKRTRRRNYDACNKI